MITNWPAPAKLNLFLYITGQRADGYHLLQTLFQFIEYGDTISIEVHNNGYIHLLTPIRDVITENNLIIRAAKLLLHHLIVRGRLPKTIGANIAVKKRLPIGGGLGGGSSDAATVLVALNHLWRGNLSQNDLILLGQKLGADVPVFIRGHTAFAQGIGEILTPIKLKKNGI